MILDEIAQTRDTLLLEALVKAPESNTAVPQNTEILRPLHRDSLSKVRIMTARLYGRWKVADAKAALLEQASNSDLSFEERIAAGDALASLDETTALTKLATENPDISIRSTAIASWAKADAREAAESAIKLLGEADSLAEPTLLFKTYRNLKGGTKILEEKLVDKKISSEVAVAGIRVAQSSGRNLANLVEILKVAGDIQPAGLSFDPDQRKALLADVEVNGNQGRGSQVYWNPQLLCSSCHQVNGEGGQIGPDLSFVGAFMTAEAILEAIVNPNTAIKQGYETVIITKKDGSVISGTLDRRTDEGARIRDTSGKIQLVPSDEIEKFEITPVSLMPPGLTTPLSYDEVVDLMTFLINLGKND